MFLFAQFYKILCFEDFLEDLQENQPAVSTSPWSGNEDTSPNQPSHSNNKFSKSRIEVLIKKFVSLVVCYWYPWNVIY